MISFGPITLFIKHERLDYSVDQPVLFADDTNIFCRVKIYNICL